MWTQQKKIASNIYQNHLKRLKWYFWCAVVLIPGLWWWHSLFGSLLFRLLTLLYAVQIFERFFSLSLEQEAEVYPKSWDARRWNNKLSSARKSNSEYSPGVSCTKCGGRTQNCCRKRNCFFFVCDKQHLRYLDSLDFNSFFFSLEFPKPFTSNDYDKTCLQWNINQIY